MIKIELTAKEKKIDIEEIVKAELKADTDLYKKEVETKEGRIVAFMYEKYYLRINSDLSVTIIYEEAKEDTNITLIASGGSIGLIGTSYGAEEKALEQLNEKLTALGFAVKEA